MKLPNSWPAVYRAMPGWARRLFRLARRRYRRLPVTRRPALDIPANWLGLFTAAEARQLAMAGFYPPPTEAVAWVRERPRRRRRRSLRRLVESLLADILKEKAWAIRALLFADQGGPKHE